MHNAKRHECSYTESNFAYCGYAECSYAVCIYAECNYSECINAKCNYAEYCFVDWSCVDAVMPSGIMVTDIASSYILLFVR